MQSRRGDWTDAGRTRDGQGREGDEGTSQRRRTSSRLARPVAAVQSSLGRLPSARRSLSPLCPLAAAARYRGSSSSCLVLAGRSLMYMAASSVPRRGCPPRPPYSSTPGSGEGAGLAAVAICSPRTSPERHARTAALAGATVSGAGKVVATLGILAVMACKSEGRAVTSSCPRRQVRSRQRIAKTRCHAAPKMAPGGGRHGHSATKAWHGLNSQTRTADEGGRL